MAKTTRTPEQTLSEATRVQSDLAQSLLRPPSVVRVQLEPTARRPTTQQPFDVAVRNRTLAIGFQRYKDFIDRVLCQRAETQIPREQDLQNKFAESRLADHVAGVGAYSLLKVATETFLLLECGVKIASQGLFNAIDEARRLGVDVVNLAELRRDLASYFVDYLGTQQLPYINRVVQAVFSDQKIEDSPFCSGLLESRVDKDSSPCFLELIWSYWHEEALLVQTINAVSLRFQNRRGPDDRNPLAHLTLDPLRPLGNLLWGYIQDEFQRLTVARRAYEYDNHYGLSLYGKAVPTRRSVESRSRFLEAFHDLLFRATVFYKEDDDTTRIADGFPLLRALREVHLLLAEGAHNQFGDLPWTSRVEMLIQQWILARPEIRDFLQSRPMVPYAEAWMPQVDTMRRLQGWSDIGVSHFRDMAVFGEQLLLSVRYGDWIDINDPTVAANWARYWRPEVQTYIHGYRAITSVDLSMALTDSRMAGERDLMPSVHLRKQIEGLKTRALVR